LPLPPRRPQCRLRTPCLERNRTFVEGYLAAPFEKALARKLPGKYLFGGWG
jgi:hypothetical protein